MIRNNQLMRFFSYSVFENHDQWYEPHRLRSVDVFVFFHFYSVTQVQNIKNHLCFLKIQFEPIEIYF